ncbi:hypothetical protein KC669_02585 [Candidatus Dojkabacteria bacterium]|uniref:Uncharacterized protein n=1 Tax=Candidatus Dojkabacteria bacterium TaxID=2099670 RepID=A0A955LA20_9BACT|nr:hypothetical protein [Candidatus Dojkabacteria bacterium]
MGLRSDINSVVESASNVLGAEDDSMPDNKAISQIQATLEYIKLNPIEATRVFNQYMDLARTMITFSEKDLNIIDKAHVKYNKLKGDSATNSASKVSTREFLKLIEEKNYEIQIDFALLLPLDISKALDPLFEMMYLASQTIFFNPEYKPVDGDPKADSMIWGHTQIESEDPRVLLHFIIAHGIERYIINVLNLDIKKDSVLNALTDALCLKNARGELDKELLDIWLNPKKPKNGQEGGMGWLNHLRVEAFDKVIQEN